MTTVTGQQVPPAGFAPPVASSDWRRVILIGHCVLVGSLGAFLFWAAVARLDGAAVAPGIVSVETNRKTIQHLEGGIIRDLLVRDGDVVQAGQTLVRLDPTKTDSAGDLYRNQLAIQLAQEARLAAERDMLDAVVLPKEVTDLAGIGIIGRSIEDQRRQFNVRREALSQAVEVATSQIGQATNESEQNAIDNRTARATLVNVNRELEIVRDLFDKNLVALPRVSALEREQLRLQGVIENTDIGITKLKERIQELTLRREQLRQDYRKDAANQLSELQKSIAELRQQVIVANDAQRRIDVRAPITGVVQQLRIFTVGGVVRPGDPILDIVPLSENLVIRARVSPLDADRVTTGMNAEIRFPSFRNLGLPVIMGNVLSISRDRLVDDATKDPYFDAQINVDRKNLPDTIINKLSAGMPAEVVIPTGERTVFAYLISPLSERFGTSMRER
jgi:HlyD family type I secretion membrane fusion protein